MRAVPDLVVVLGADDEALRGEPRGRAPVPPISRGRVLALEGPAVAIGAREGLDRAEALVVGVALPGEERVERVVEVVAPDGVEAEAAERPLPHEAGVVGVALGDHVDRTAERRRLGVDGSRELLEERPGRSVHERVDGVEPEAVHVKVADPVEGVLEEEAPHLVRAGPVEVERCAPGRRVGAREVGAELREVVPLRAEVVVDDVEDDREPERVRRVHETLHGLRAAERGLDGEEVDAVVAPVPLPRALRDGHDLDRRHSEVQELREPRARRVERALAGEGPHVELVEDELAERLAAPAVVRPEERGVHDLRRAVDALGLEARGGVRAVAVAEAKEVARPGRDPVEGARVVTALVAHEGKDPSARAHEAHRDALRARRPDLEARAALTEGGGSERGSHTRFDYGADSRKCDGEGET